MKSIKFITLLSCLIVFLFLPQTISAQWFGATDLWGTSYRYGRVGIGFTSSTGINNRLEVNGDVGVSGNLKINQDIQGLASGHANLFIFANTNTSDGPYIRLYGPSHTNKALKFFYDDGRVSFSSVNGDDLVRIHTDGTMIIGGTDTGVPPAGYKLAVEDGIISQQVRVVESKATWADYVFEADYKRATLEEVEAYVKEQKHLPNVPSAEEVAEKGVEMVEMDATLLRQIEELWLHLIDLKKENDALKEKVQALEAELEK